MRLLADENFPGEAMRAIRSRGHDLVWIRGDAPDISDQAVPSRTTIEGGILVTFDKNFGDVRRRKVTRKIVKIRRPGHVDEATEHSGGHDVSTLACVSGSSPTSVLLHAIAAKREYQEITISAPHSRNFTFLARNGRTMGLDSPLLSKKSSSGNNPSGSAMRCCPPES